MNKKQGQKMSKTGSPNRVTNGGGRMIKWKGRAASLAPSLLLGTVSVLALQVGAAQAETIDAERTAPFVTTADEDHAITQDGSVTVTPLSDRAVVTIDLADYTGTLTNAGTVAASQMDGRTHAGIEVNGTLTGGLNNSGSVTLQGTGNSAADLRGIDLDAVGGSVSNSGAITVVADATSQVRAIGINGSDLSGTLDNSGTIDVTADGSSALAAGIYLRATTGTVENSGTVTVTANGTGSSATAYGVRLIGVAGAFRNSGTIDVTANAGSEASAYGLSAYGISGTVENSGTLRVAATGSTNPNAYGVTFSTVDAGARLDNSGTIEVTATGTPGSSSGEAVGISGTAVEGTLSNSGTIAASASGGSQATAAGISVRFLDSTLTNSGTIAALSSNASSVFATGVVARHVSGTIANSGTITATATGNSYAYATGIHSDILGTDASLQNSGTIVATVQSSSSSGSATGIRSGLVQGALTNSGTLQVSAEAGTGAYAEGIGTIFVQSAGQVRNSGDILVTARSQSSSASAYGFRSLGSEGTVENSGTIEVGATGAEARALGIQVGELVGGPFANMTGQMTNTGLLRVTATGSDSATAYGLRTNTVVGLVENAGVIEVMTSGGSSGGLATGIDIRQVDVAGTVRNSGDITVTADYSNATQFYAAGIGLGQMDGTAENSGNIHVTAPTASSATASDAFVAGIAAYDMAGSVTHSGTIEVTSAGGGGSKAYGIFANTLSGTLNVTGDISAMGADQSYAIYAGGGAGLLNIETSARIDGLIRVEDHDVTLTHTGGSRVYRFEDANSGAGTFTTEVTVDNGIWLTQGSGGAAPVYASVDGADFTPDRLLPFQLGALADGLHSELSLPTPAVASRDALFAWPGQPSLRSFARVGFSHADGADEARSNLGHVTAGLTGQAGDTRFGFGLGMVTGRASHGANSTETQGLFLNAEAVRDLGFAKLSFGLGLGQFSHDNRRAIGGSADALGQFDSTLAIAHLGLSRDIDLSDRLTLTPRASYRIGRQHLQGYTETGSSADATLPSRSIRFDEAKIGASLAAAHGNGVFSLGLDAVHRSSSSPELMDVTVFGTSTAFTTGGRQDQTVGQLSVAYQTSFGDSDLLTLSADSTFGGGTTQHRIAAEYVWEF